MVLEHPDVTGVHAICSSTCQRSWLSTGIGRGNFIKGG